MENLEKVMEFHFFSRPGKVMEIESRFWKVHKRSLKLKGILSRNSGVPFFHPVFQYKDTFRSNFGVFHIFLYCDWNLVSGSQRHNWRVLVVSMGACGLDTCVFHATKHVKGP